MDKNKSDNNYPAPIVVNAIRLFGLAISKVFWRIKYYQTENIPHDLKGGLLVTPNHQTYFDPFWVAFPIKRNLRFMAWDKAFDWFLVGSVIRYLGSFPVSLERGGTRKAMVQALRALRDGGTLFIFPEGAREFSNGELLEFKTGAVRIAVEAGVPILPVTIRGANKVWAQDMKYPHFGKVEIFYHPILEVAKPDESIDDHEHAEQITEKLKTIIESKL